MGEALDTVGALGFGLVLGWASAFVALSPHGSAFRLLAVLAATAFAGLLGLAGALLGLAAHEIMIAALRRRIA